MKVNCVVDISKKRLWTARNKIGKVRVFSSVEEFLDSGIDVDFIDIATPPNSHLSIVNKVSILGRPIILEKPMEIEEARLEDVRKVGSVVPMLPCNIYGHSDTYRCLIEDVVRERVPGPDESTFIVMRKRPCKGTEDYDSLWRVKKEISGGGILIDHGYHIFYLLSRLFQEQPIINQAKLQKLLYPVEDWVYAEGKIRNTTFRIFLTWIANTRHTLHLHKFENRILLVSGVEHYEMIPIKEDIKVVEESSFDRDSFHTLWYYRLFKKFLEDGSFGKGWEKELRAGYVANKTILDVYGKMPLPEAF